MSPHRRSCHTTDTTQTLCLVRVRRLEAAPRVESTLEERQKVVKGSCVFCHFGRVWSQCVTNAQSVIHIQTGVVWSQRSSSARGKKAAKGAPILSRAPDKQKADACRHTEHRTLYFCQTIPLTFIRNSRLRAPERVIWERRLPKIGCLFIFKASDITCFI